MNTINNPVTRQYYVASDNGTVLAYGYVDPGQRVDSGAATFETMTDVGVYNAKLLEFGIQPEDLWGGTLPADLVQAALILKARVNVLRIDKLSMPVTFLSHPFQSDAEAIANITGVLAAVGVGLPLPANFSWRSADNVNVPMNAQVLLGLAGTLMTYRNACYVRSWTLKAQLDAASDPSTIDLASGWPDNTNPFA